MGVWIKSSFKLLVVLILCDPLRKQECPGVWKNLFWDPSKHVEWGRPGRKNSFVFQTSRQVVPEAESLMAAAWEFRLSDVCSSKRKG